MGSRNKINLREECDCMVQFENLKKSEISLSLVSVSGTLLK